MRVFLMRKSGKYVLTLGLLVCCAECRLSRQPGVRRERGPPRQGLSASLAAPPPWTDISDYVALGDGKGSAIAYGDFTRDRFGDLVMADSRDLIRSIHVSAWRPKEYMFQPVSRVWNSSAFSTNFSLDSMPSLPSSAYIACIGTADGNADGNLDIVMSIYVGHDMYVGLVLFGNGMGGLRPGSRLVDLGPDFLLMDGDNDLITDILFSRPDGSLAFYHNKPPGTFTIIPWQPFSSAMSPSLFQSHALSSNLTEASMYEDCFQSRLVASNAFVDMDGDCLPDVVLTTANCGILVWLNRATPSTRRSKELATNDEVTVSTSSAQAFWNLSIFLDKDRFVPISRTVWDRQNGDGVPIFADFNADGTNDIAVPNRDQAIIRISINTQLTRKYGELCTSTPAWSLDPYNAIHGLRLAPTVLGRSVVPGTIHVGDFNYDGVLDILVINGDSGTIELYEALRSPSEYHGLWNDAHPASAESFSYDLESREERESERRQARVFFRHVSGEGVLLSLEDPVAAAFVDSDESGRQDLLIVQNHGTRLVRNNYNEVDDSEFFKATSSNAVVEDVYKARGSGGARNRPLVPIHGGTIKISYGGVKGREQHICSQCPQTGLLSLQSCSCLFGIRRIANYIEEMSIGGGGRVKSWSALMPNAIAILWPVDARAAHWRVAYFTTRRGRQMAGVVVVLAATLVVLAVTIALLYREDRRTAKTHEQPWQNSFGT